MLGRGRADSGRLDREKQNEDGATVAASIIYSAVSVAMMGAPGMRSAVLAPVARLRVVHFRFLCRLSRLAPDHRCHARFSRDGGSLCAGLSLKS